MKTFKALECVGISKDYSSAIENLVISTKNSIPLQDDQVRVKIIASSLNFPDILLLVGKYQYKPELPFTPGTEGSGIITEVGKNVKKTKVGDEVVVSMVIGSHAEEIVVFESQCFPKPRNFSHEEAAGLSVGFCTAFHGLIQRGKLQANETLLVTGAGGGMGVAAIQLGKLVGAKVIAAASSSEKLAVAKQAGADEFVNYTDEDLNKEVKRLTNGQGADVIYDVVGGTVFDKCTRCVNGGGRLLVIGFASGKIPKIPANLPLVKGYSVVGVRAGAEMQLNPSTANEMFEALSKWGAQEVLPKPIAKSCYNVEADGIEGIKKAFQELAFRKATGKIVLVWQKPLQARL